jgi:hypothetical protein
MRASLLKLCLVSAVCVTIIFTTFLAYWAAEVGDPPYFGWGTTVKAAWTGSVYALMFSTFIVCLLCAALGLIGASFTSLYTNYSKIRPWMVLAFRAIIAATLYSAAASILLLPWQALAGARAMPNPLDPVPFWADNIIAKHLGSPYALLWLFAFIVLISAWSVHRALRPPRRDRCTHCDYDLTNLQAQTCPECNTPITKL